MKRRQGLAAWRLQVTSMIWLSPLAVGASEAAAEQPQAAVIEAAAAAAEEELRPEEENEINLVASNMCTCDCCQVEERFPSEIVRLSNNKELKHKCVWPPGSDQCPRLCTKTPTEPSEDYSHFCLLSCRPMLASPGTICSLDTTAVMEQRDVYLSQTAEPLPVAEEVPEMAWEEQAERKKVLGQFQKVQAKQTRKTKPKILKWNFQDVVANRLRAEAGADLSHSAAVGERVRINAEIVERNVKRVVKVKEAVADLETYVDESIATTASGASSATDAAKKTKMLLKAAKATFGPAMRDTREMVAKMVQEDDGMRVAAEEEARAYAKWREWDKPEQWPRALANQAAVPYLRGMADATLRVAQYQNAASGLAEQAQALRAQAAELPPQVATSGAQGDLIGKAMQEEEMRRLMMESQGLDQKAQQYWKVAGQVHGSIPQWQQVASAASAYEVASRAAKRRELKPLIPEAA